MNRPISQIHRGLIASWKCMQKRNWEISSLNSRFGNSLFSCGMNTQDDNEPVLVKLKDFLKYHVNDKPLESIHKSNLFNLPYIFDPSFEVDCPELLEDYSVPSLFDNLDKIRTLDTRLKPDYRWFLLGGVGSGSSLHVDPCFTSAWNAVVCGRKLWIVIDPNIFSHITNFEVFTMQAFITDIVFDHLFSRKNTSKTNDPVMSRSISQAIHKEIVEFLVREMTMQYSKVFKHSDAYDMIHVFFQEEGEVLYVPSNWYHAAINLMPTVAITHNFVEDENKEKFLSAYKSEVESKFSDHEWKIIESVVMSN